MRKSTKELFEELQSRLILNLKENEVPCPTCKGLQKVYREENGKGYVSNCLRCYTGRLYVCKYCGCHYKSMCTCEDSMKAKNLEADIKKDALNKYRFEQAKKVNYEDYDGFFLIGDDRVWDKDEFEEWVYTDYEEYKYDTLPEYVWATKPEQVFDLDLYEILLEKTEDGYEDMIDFLDTNDELILQAQKLLNEWLKKQGENLNVYNEDYSTAVLVGDVVKEILSKRNSG